MTISAWVFAKMVLLNMLAPTPLSIMRSTAALVINFVLGMPMNLGFGLYAPCMGMLLSLCMVRGVMLIALIEYIQFFFGIGPGADLLFSSTLML